MPCKPDCGLCCEAIALRVDPDVVRDIVRGFGGPIRDLDKLHRFFSPISKEEAARRNPRLVAVHENHDRATYARLGPYRYDWTHLPLATYWECNQYDPASKQCLAYEDRPHTCRDFPAYGKAAPTAELLAPWPTCGYWADIGADLTPLPMHAQEEACS